MESHFPSELTQVKSDQTFIQSLKSDPEALFRHVNIESPPSHLLTSIAAEYSATEQRREALTTINYVWVVADRFDNISARPTHSSSQNQILVALDAPGEAFLLPSAAEHLAAGFCGAFQIEVYGEDAQGLVFLKSIPSEIQRHPDAVETMLFGNLSSPHSGCIVYVDTFHDPHVSLLSAKIPLDSGNDESAAGVMYIKLHSKLPASEEDVLEIIRKDLPPVALDAISARKTEITILHRSARGGYDNED